MVNEPDVTPGAGGVSPLGNNVCGTLAPTFPAPIPPVVQSPLVHPSTLPSAVWPKNSSGKNPPKYVDSKPGISPSPSVSAKTATPSAFSAPLSSTQLQSIFNVKVPLL